MWLACPFRRRVRPTKSVSWKSSKVRNLVAPLARAHTGRLSPLFVCVLDLVLSLRARIACDNLVLAYRTRPWPPLKTHRFLYRGSMSFAERPSMAPPHDVGACRSWGVQH